jgi:hypothetical protein
MLAQAIEQGVITQEEADVFELVHGAMNGYMGQMSNRAMGTMGDMQEMMLSALVSNGEITQEQADVFNDVHDRLLTAGLMQ